MSDTREGHFTVLNTRPLPMGEHLQQLLLSSGLTATYRPQIGTKELRPDKVKSAETWLAESNCAWIFVSRTAVRLFFSQFDSNLAFSPSGPVIAVGSGTQSELLARWPNLAVQLPEQANSESIIKMSELANVHRVALIKGKGGRELIESNLTARNKLVENVEVYERVGIDYSSSDVTTWTQSQLVLTTSVDIAKNLFANLTQLPPTELETWLSQCNWLVLSERIKQYLLTKGIEQSAIFICEDADNSSIIKTIKNIKQ